jgi:acyl carrier protein
MEKTLTEEEFLENMQDLLGTESTLALETELYDLDEWDSMCMLNTFDFAEENFNITLDVADFKEFVTVGDIFRRLTRNGR